MKIRLYQHKEEYCNYLDLYLLFLILLISKVTKDSWIGENNYCTSIELNTKCTYTKSSIGWYFCFIVLGFGISINR